MLRQQMGSLRSLQNECIVFVHLELLESQQCGFEVLRWLFWTGFPVVGGLSLPPITWLPRPYKYLKWP